MTGLGFNRQIHRGTVADENRTTQVPGAPLPPPQSAVPQGTAVRSEEGAKKRRSNGKAPAAKARRDDPEAQLLTGFAPGQKEALQYAYTAFNSPSTCAHVWVDRADALQLRRSRPVSQSASLPPAW